ncbi:hypothetical protein MMAD_53450 [Mycolicibacterium madagascariense]|uniref:Uncharacterized protein n=1 Tax=Mycolicibacterium madagascariense TaxID=212765 RepID=A0A7I7XPA9_9MYCO|nr:hypothetical protein [Mycolicibacterium madagascariense]MCV7014025.1 hypothetical protein [Mycolicibacterium madagascariense]BBZ31050.1 hypothetical protein MMAD_53450 [Mycolicibacterium madagascariense]
MAVVLLVVIGVSVAATLYVTGREGGRGATALTTGTPSDYASANDTGPVSIITDEPTCGAWVGISNELSEIERGGWGEMRGTLGPTSLWTAQQREEIDLVVRAMRNAADRSIELAKQTPHRVVRELYEQFSAYGRAYINSTYDYEQIDDELASANVNAASAVIGICNTITFGSASRGITVPKAPRPSGVAKPEKSSAPRTFMSDPDPECSGFIQRLDDFNIRTALWASADAATPASQWNPLRRVLEQSVQPLLEAYANEVDEAARRSFNPVLSDFAFSTGRYLMAYLTVGDEYDAADGWLSSVAFKFANLVSAACSAAGR